MKYILFIFIISFLTSCQNSHDGYAITGNVKDIEDGKMVYVSQIDANTQPRIIDSVAIENGEFSLHLPNVDSPNLSFLTIPGYNGNVMFISENETINFEIYKDSLPVSKVNGGPENQVFSQYIDHFKDLNKRMMNLRMEMNQQMSTTRDSAAIMQLQQEEESIRLNDLAFKKKLVRDNPEAFVSVLAVTDMMSVGAPASEVREHFELLSPELKATSLGTNLKSSLDLRSATEIGSKEIGRASCRERV